MRKARWVVYVLRCANGAFYTGVTTDLPRRVAQHNAGRGAHYTRVFGPVEPLWCESQPGRSAALRREAAIKRLPRGEKEKLVRGGIAKILLRFGKQGLEYR